MIDKKTKIVATVGPASKDKAVLAELIKEGVNVFRLNFSHGEHAVQSEVIKNIRALNEELGTHTAILGDLQGPKLRVGQVENNSVILENGKEIILTSKECLGTTEKISLTYDGLARDVAAGEKILINDGLITLEVISTNGNDEVKAKIIHGGELSSRKGINLPNTKISLPSLTEKDLADLEFILENDLDWVALSFVRSASDIIELKHIIANHKKQTKVISKIEKPEALEEIDEIIKETDGLMVARGDLGVEIPMAEVPLVQKMLIKKCLKHAKPAIVATQMMESMIHNVSPTRAEVNDVANAVLDGTDAVMLSGETAMGKHPVKVIQAMTKIVKQIEESDIIYHTETIPEKNHNRFISDSICFNASRLAKRVDAKAIVTMTFSGYTAFKISSQRPKAGIFVFTSNARILTMLSLVWGVQGLKYDKFVSTDHTIADIKHILRKKGYVESGDLVINLASMPIETRGMSNMLKLSHVD